jgi:hypothetical protein
MSAPWTLELVRFFKHLVGLTYAGSCAQIDAQASPARLFVPGEK